MISTTGDFCVVNVKTVNHLEPVQKGFFGKTSEFMSGRWSQEHTFCLHIIIVVIVIVIVTLHDCMGNVHRSSDFGIERYFFLFGL